MNGNIPTLALINKRGLSEKIWIEHLMTDSSNILEVPDRVGKKIISKEIAYKIVSDSFSLISYIPISVKDKSFMLDIWSKREDIQSFDVDFFLKNSPRSLFDVQFCKECIKSYPLNNVLKYFPTKCLSRHFWEYALHLNGLLIKSIRKETLNNKLLLIAINNNAMALKYIPIELRSKKLSQISIQKDVRAIMYAAFK